MKKDPKIEIIDDIDKEIDKLLEELDMSLGKDMLEMDEFNGNTIPPSILPVLQTPKDDYDAVCERLTNIAQKTWICLTYPEGYSIGKEISDCSPEEFCEWVNLVYPPAKAMEHGPKDYQTLQQRTVMWFQVVNLVEHLKPAPKQSA
jgi:hypothetical protein